MSELEGVQALSPAMQGFVHIVRTYTRDHPLLNRLIAGQESSDPIIAWATMDAISDFNGTPHFTFMTLEDLLAKNQQALLTRMTTVTLLESVGLLQTRNHINYSNGGINVGVNDKTPLIMNWLSYFKGSIEQRKQQVKIAINIEGILGTPGAHSELWSINASYIAY